MTSSARWRHFHSTTPDRRRSPAAGGHDFAADPDQPFGALTALWSRLILPTVLILKPLAPGQTLAPRRLDVHALSDVRLIETPDGVYITCVCGGVTWQLWMERNWHRARHFAFDHAYDRFTPLRAHETLRFWRVLSGLSDPGPWHRMSRQSLDRHILALRVADARAAGMSERVIAERLFDQPVGRSVDWPDLSLRAQFRRLDQLGKRMIDGGYRDLMGYPLSRRT
ncbi:DUF2285 domain-containing protein [Acetobacter malorum]|uniref:DUF2285 domain-containing protein n=1 Tax=Acetobacter malorum TaxID=178901 RepID=UPI0012E76450|nr:DUF2285 domain-containing protein [Acetobacter malorum]